MCDHTKDAYTKRFRNASLQNAHRVSPQDDGNDVPLRKETLDVIQSVKAALQRKV